MQRFVKSKMGRTSIIDKLHCGRQKTFQRSVNECETSTDPEIAKTINGTCVQQLTQTFGFNKAKTKYRKNVSTACLASIIKGNYTRFLIDS